MNQFQVFWVVVDVVALTALVLLPTAGSKRDLWRVVIAAHLIAAFSAFVAAVGPEGFSFPAMVIAYSVIPLAYAFADVAYRWAPLPGAFVAVLLVLGVAIYAGRGMGGLVLVAIGYAAVATSLFLKAVLIPRLQPYR
jgi:hypothetical protein